MKGARHLRTTLFILSGLATLPFLMNCVGYASYLYLKSTDQQLIVGVAAGAVHLAKDTSDISMSAEDSLEFLMPEIQTITLIKSEKLDWFIEGGHGLPLNLFSFNRSEDSEYSTIEFPYLLIPLLLLVAGFTIPVANRMHGQDSGVGD